MKATASEMATAKKWAGRLVEGAVAVSHRGEGVDRRLDARVYQDFPAMEWTGFLKNEGDSDSPILEDIQALDAIVDVDEACTVHWSVGSACTADDFGPRERALHPGGRLRLQPGGGRSSSEVMPFLNVDLGGRGIIIAVGWTGEWAAEFVRHESGALRIRVGMDHTYLKLHPGEEIRTPKVLLLFWEGERIRGHNLLRRLILKHHRPMPNGEPLVAPLTCGNWGGTSADVHLDTIRKIAEHGLPYEYYWIDAGWFGGPGVWWEHNGNWEPREELYPEGLRPVSDAAHAAGMKFLLWWEPERVAPGTPWAEECAEWLLGIPAEEAIAWDDYGLHMAPEEWLKAESNRNQLNRGDKLLDLGNPEARRFLTDYLSEKIDEYGIECFRQDSNIAQLPYWRNADAPDRQGITEIRYVEGQYALWDELLERHPGLIIDNCGSGARRIDLETIGRSVPLWRTDHIHMGGTPTTAQSQTYGLLHWVPLNGTMAGYLHDVSDYRLRSLMCSALQAALWGQGDAPQERVPDDYPFAEAKRLLEQYLSVRGYYYGDFYPLTEYTLAEDAWCAYQLDRPEQGDGLVVVLKRPESSYTEARFRLRGLEAEGVYAATDLDTGAAMELEGEALRVRIAEAPGSAVIRYRLVEA